MAEKTTLTISLQLGKDASGHASAEIDSRPEGLNAKKLGRTSDFQGGDKIAVLVYLSEGLTINESKDVYHSWQGKVTGLSFKKKGKLSSDDEVKLKEQLKFGNMVSSASISKPAKVQSGNANTDEVNCNDVTFYFCGDWVGYEPVSKGNVKLWRDAQTVNLKLDTNATDSLDKLKPPAIFSCQYVANAELWEIVLPKDTNICNGLKPNKPPYPLEIVMIARPKKETNKC